MIWRMLGHGAHSFRGGARRAGRGAVAIVCLLAALKVAPGVLAQTSTSSLELIEKGRLIYEVGQLGSGEPLTGNRGEDGIGQRLASIATKGAVLGCSKPPIWCHP